MDIYFFRQRRERLSSALDCSTLDKEITYIIREKSVTITFVILCIVRSTRRACEIKSAGSMEEKEFRVGSLSKDQ